MPSHVDATNDPFAFEHEDEHNFPVRTTIEWVLRAISLVTLVFLIWQAFHLLRERPTGRAESGKILEALTLWSTRETPHRVHVVFDSVPSPDVRDWLAAFPAAATQMSWDGPTLKPTAVAAEPIADPQHATRIWIASPDSGTVIVRDTLGIIDTVFARSGGAVLTASNVTGTVHASIDGTTASSALHDSVIVKPVLILGIASWEGKFIMASLEEHGWKTDGHFNVSPRAGGLVVQGPPTPQIDTAHYSAVIALDTAAAKYAGAIEAFVRQGGGFIATGDAAGLSAFASIMPATMGAAIPIGDQQSFDLDSLAPKNALALTPIKQLKPNAVAVERRGKDVAVAAWRVRDGRAMQVGYTDTWRWRMGGLGDPVGQYRHWWSMMVSSVAYAPRFSRVVAGSVEPTPMASLVKILGTPTPQKVEKASLWDDPRLLPALFALLMTTFLLEWASRRLRGRP